MTTNERQTLSDSPDEAAIPVTEAPRIEDESPADAPDPLPAADAEVSGADPIGGQQPAPRHQSSADELLFAEHDLADLRARWAGVQAAFVDDPKDCVHKADVLVSDLVEQLTSGFAQARSRLEEQWSRGKEASTEDLRMALMHYREFFERLLAV
jgi:hypothetical protein